MNEVVPIGDLGVQKYTAADYKSVASSAFMPYIQLMTSSSKPCKAGTFPVNNYAYVQSQTHTDLGKTVDVVLIAWRPRAMETGGETPMSIFDQKKDASGFPTGEFARIMNKADTVKDSGCMYGPEFLVWLPIKREFVTLFMSSKTSRNEAGNWVDPTGGKLGKAITLSSSLIKGGKYEWQGIRALDCSTQLEPPDGALMASVLEKFNNPPESALEVAEEPATASGREV